MMENLNKCYKVVQQRRTGISAIALAEDLKIHRTTAHSYLNTLELMGKVYSEKGLWYPKKLSTPKKLPSEESETDKVKAYQIMASIEALGMPLTKKERDYFNQNDGKSKLDKARALLIKKSTEALMG